MKILSVFHILIALIFAFDVSNTQKVGKKDWIFSAVCVIAAVFLLIAGIFNKKLLSSLSKHLALLLFEFMLILGAAIYYWGKDAPLIAISHALLAGAILLFWLYLKRREDGERIVISDANIILPGLTGDRIVEWNQLSNVVKKHDLLTLDFKSNKLLHVQVINADHINEEEFNQFCLQQLEK